MIRTLRQADLGRLVRFVAVGAVNTLITLLAYAALTGLGASIVVASAVGFALGAANGYVLNRWWTFERAHGGLDVGARYVAVQGGGLALNAAGVWFAARGAHLPHLAAESVILPVVTVTTFLVSRTWVFQATRSSLIPRAPSPPPRGHHGRARPGASRREPSRRRVGDRLGR